MMNAKEKAEAKYVITHLNEIFNLTHGLKLVLDEETETVKAYNLSASSSTSPLLEVNIADDSAQGVLGDVIGAINKEYPFIL